MRLEEEHRDELAGCMAELLEKGDVRGKPLRGDNKVLDVTVIAIAEQSLRRLELGL
jgi:hypothetical protein